MSSTSRIANLIDISIHLKKLPLLKIKKRKLKGDDFYLKKFNIVPLHPPTFDLALKHQILVERENKDLAHLKKVLA